MYKFIDTIPQKCHYEEEKPVSAMNYDGLFLEDYIDGYTTLSVTGREMLNVDFSFDNLLVGSELATSRLPSRVLTINYQIKNNDPEKLLLEFRKMMNFLYKKEPVIIWFNDELDVYYQGMYTSYSDVSGSSNSIISSFDIVCPIPLKTTVKTYLSNDGYIALDTPLDVYPTYISLKIDRDIQFSLTNGIETIELVDKAVKVGDILKLDFKKGKIFINSKDSTNKLKLSSDFENFRLRQGSRVASSSGNPVITYKGVTL